MHIEADGHDIEITHPDKVLFPKDGITKADVADYYKRIAEFMVPHTTDHPISMQRFPEGIGEDGFYQKAAADYFPDFIQRVNVTLRETGETKTHICINNNASLVYLANQGVITSHLWLSRKDKLEHPDKMIFDFDPEDIDTFPEVVRVAKGLHALCEELEIPSFPMTTGSLGLHVVIPLKREMQFSDVKSVANAIAEVLTNRFSDLLTLAQRKDKREGKIFMDTLRNAYGQTGVAPYSLRPRDGAPVATPLSWNEVNGKLHPQKYHINNIFKRLGQKGDPWKEVSDHAVSPSRILAGLKKVR